MNENSLQERRWGVVRSVWMKVGGGEECTDEGGVCGGGV